VGSLQGCEVIRNLIFYCYPVKGTVWEWHAEQLKKYKSAWNGRRILVLSLDHMTVPEEKAREHFASLEAEVLIRKNHRHLHETAHFIEALSLLESRRSDEATFYAHAKGITRTGGMLEAMKRWSTLMYEANLSFPELIERKLSTFAAIGCLRWRLDRTPKKWCYAGTFFWLRHDAIFSKNWRDISQEKYGVEDYPGRHLEMRESCCLTLEQVPPISLYEGWINEQMIKSTVEKLRVEDLCTHP
jgi:hypothetical protein